MTDSTDNAPERIWAWARADNWDTNGHCTSKQEWAEDGDIAYIRADLAPDPLSDPRVKALVEAVTLAISCGVIWRDESAREFQTSMRCYEALAAALAAFEGGKADD